jgi:hypothetical protein
MFVVSIQARASEGKVEVTLSTPTSSTEIVLRRGTPEDNWAPDTEADRAATRLAMLIANGVDELWLGKALGTHEEK